jgi:hypothetical protein
VAAVCWLGACGELVEPDLSTLHFQLLPMKYAVDARLLSVPATFYRLRCGEDEGVCCRAFDCAVLPLLCRQDACVTDFRFEAYVTVDLRAEAPALTRLGVQHRSALVVSRLHVDAENALNMDLPPLELWLAPVHVNTANHPDAEHFATLPALPAQRRRTGAVVEVPPAAQAAFARYARAWGAFNMIAVAPLGIASTDRPLAGNAAMTVRIELAASLDP